MSRILSRAAAATAAAAAAVTLAGCHFAIVPPKPAPHATPVPTATRTGDPAAARAADAPALLIQCLADRGVLRPAGQDWLSRGKVTIDGTTATDFDTWWRAHFTPGPYPQTFTIDGHATHYLAFGATWIRKGGQWVPTHTALNDPAAQRTSLYAWSLWAAANDRLPAEVCGPGVSARALQSQVYGSVTGNPWGP